MCETGLKKLQNVIVVMRCVICFVCFLAYSPGLWKIVAKFSNNPDLRFTAEFEVKDYGKYTWGEPQPCPRFRNDDFPFETLQWCRLCQ